MNEKIARDIASELNKVKQTLAAMNVNHAEIGKLFKAWLEVEEPIELEMTDRPAFTIGMPVRCTDITSAHYKHIGTIEQITTGPVHVKFQHLREGATAALQALQIEVLPQPKLNIGDNVRVIDPHSIAYKEIGEVVKTAFEGVEVEFPSGSGGDFDRRNLELVAPKETD